MYTDHPGTMLKAVLDGKGLSVKAAAEQIGVDYLTLWNIVNAKSAITPRVAALIELWDRSSIEHAICAKTSGEAWLFRQAAHNLDKARKELV